MTERAPFQQRLYSLSLSGPISARKSSFFLDFQRREINGNNVINALVLDSTLNPVRFNQVIAQPRRFITLPKLKVALNPFIIARTGQFFNITTGLDSNGDRLFLSFDCDSI